MSYLIDTNAISELARKQPEPRVIAWFESVPDAALHLSVLTLGELRKGVERLKDTSRQERLRLWLELDLPRRFQERILSIDAAVAERWGRLLASGDRPVPAIASLLAATALHHELRVVTRNARDFEPFGVEVVNPWGA